MPAHITVIVRCHDDQVEVSPPCTPFDFLHYQLMLPQKNVGQDEVLENETGHLIFEYISKGGDGYLLDMKYN